MIRCPVKDVCQKGQKVNFSNVATLDKIEILKSSISVKCRRKKSTWQGDEESLRSQGWEDLSEHLSESPHVELNLSEGKEPDLQRCRRNATRTEEWKEISLASSGNGKKPYG